MHSQNIKHKAIFVTIGLQTSENFFTDLKKSANEVFYQRIFNFAKI